jgi:predicted DNA-binding transcriptional regulator YafY
VRADRLVSLALLLQARGRTTARSLADELAVSVRTIYRDLEALSAAGVPVFTESGPGGGCELLDGYRFPLRALRPEEAEALLILGVPGPLRELGLGDAVTAAHRQIRVTAGLESPADDPGQAALVHLDMPRWFRSREDAPQLRSLAEALSRHRCLELRYQRGGGAGGALGGAGGGAGDTTGGEPPPRARIVAPLGLVNKAGTWYLVAVTSSGRTAVFRAGRITSARVLAEPASRPAGFELAEYWERWSREFAASRSRLRVTLRAAPGALAVFPEVFGDEVQPAIAAARPAGDDGWQELTLSFEHELAAAHRLAGFGDQVQVVSPPAVGERLLAIAHGIIGRYGAERS